MVIFLFVIHQKKIYHYKIKINFYNNSNNRNYKAQIDLKSHNPAIIRSNKFKIYTYKIKNNNKVRYY